jgi:hypothetical protein
MWAGCWNKRLHMNAPTSVDEQMRHLADTLSDAERMLILLNRELYNGQWDQMRDDLEARLVGRPYMFKLAYRIEDDLARVARLWAFERTNKVTLSDYVQLDDFGRTR